MNWSCGCGNLNRISHKDCTCPNCHLEVRFCGYTRFQIAIGTLRYFWAHWCWIWNWKIK